MKYFLYLLASICMRGLSFLPDFLLYRISDLFFIILYYLVGYRKQVATENIKKAFPEYSEKKRNSIRRGFYRHLSDLIIENAVAQYYSKRRISKMYQLDNPELYNRYYNENRHVIVLAGHYNNWEWAPIMSFTVQHKVLALYKPLHNKYFDKAIQKSRTRFGAVSTPMGNILRTMLDFQKQSIPTLSGVIADQRPRKKETSFWTTFMGIKTAAYNGAEKLARKFNAVVVTINVRKLKRGRYTGETIIITEDPNSMKENEITSRFFNHLESLIREEPRFWLWSHKRWKFSFDDWIEYKKSLLE